MVYVKKFIHSKEELLAEGQKIMTEDADSKYLFRVCMVNLMLSGMKASELSGPSGVNERTLTGWVDKVDREGFEVLMAVKQPGRPPKLTAEQEEEIKFLLEEDDPEKHGYRVWDGPSMSDYIRKNMGVEYTPRSCQKLFHRLNFSKIVPQMYPSLETPDDAARNKFKEEVAAAFADPSLVMVFQDEVHFEVQTSVTRKWAPVGSKPRVMSLPGRHKASYSGFVMPSTGKLWVSRPDWFNFQTVIESLEEFLASNPLPKGKRYCIVMDNAPWHKKAKRLIMDEANPEYQRLRESMTVIKLPPYSPDLNPIEQAWRVTRREVTHNRYFPNVDSLKQKLDSFFSKFEGPNKKFKHLCTFGWMVDKTIVQTDSPT